MTITINIQYENGDPSIVPNRATHAQCTPTPCTFHHEAYC